jgi:hypothetical protein
MTAAMRADNSGDSVAAAATVAMSVADNNRNCGAGNNQQNAADGSGSSGDSGRGSGDRCSAAAMAGRGGGMAEVTTMQAAATATGRFIHKEEEMVKMRRGEVVTWNLFMICDFFTLISLLVMVPIGTPTPAHCKCSQCPMDPMVMGSRRTQSTVY